MPIGIVTDNDFELELNNLKNEPKVVTGEVVDKPHKGRSEGDVNVPESLRKIIGETGAVDSRQEALALAQMFGISSSSVSAYTNGATSTSSYNEPDKELKKHINFRKELVIGKAHERLDSALDSITPEKLAGIKARDLAGIAKDMSAIIKNMEPENKEVDDKPRPQFVVYAPQFRREENFEVIVVSE